ncbi:MAG: ABC transporter permease [Chloroflexota bacterium]
MKKAFIIAWKDLRIKVSDRSAFLFLVITPLVITVIMGAAFGGFSEDDNSPISDVQVAIANQDQGELGDVLEQILLSDELTELLAVQVVDNDAQARGLVDDEDYSAAVIIPADYSERAIGNSRSSIIPSSVGETPNSAGSDESAVIEVYANPTSSIGADIIRAIVEGFSWQLSSNLVGSSVAIQELLASGELQLWDIESYVNDMSVRLQDSSSQSPVELVIESSAGERTVDSSDWIVKYFAPSMAIMFLSFGVTGSARTILDEERAGTLNRLISSPTGHGSILAGKLISTFVTGLIQFSVLVIISTLIFQLDWGNPLGVALLSLATVLAMTSLGVAIAAIVRDDQQVNTWGVAVLMVFGAIGGHFFPRINYPDWLKNIGLFTPNAWALDGFTKLGTGSSVAEISTELAALAGIALILFTLGIIRFRRRFVK